MKFNEQRVRQLIEGGAPESRILDYKEQFYEGGDKGNHQILKHVSAFANTSGGQIIFGVKEKDGEIEVAGIDVAAIDGEIQRIQSTLTVNIDPRIEHIDFNRVDIGKESLLVVDIPVSYRAPHRVRDGNKSYFYIRTATQAESMDTQQIRQAFNRTEDLYAKARSFRDSRLDKIILGETPRELSGQVKLVIHVFPLAGPNETFFAYATDFPTEFKYPATNQCCEWRRLNFEGALYSYGSINHPGKAYVQIFRSGAIETVLSLESDRFSGISFDELYRIFISDAKAGIEHCETVLRADLLVMFSIIGAKGIDFHIGTFKSLQFDRELLCGPEILVSDPDASQVALRELFRPALNLLYQSAGGNGDIPK